MKDFRTEVTAKNSTVYIPVTMDELMARFVTNMERADCQNRFKQEKANLYKDSLLKMNAESIEENVVKSMNALRDLLANNTIDMERQPNTENQLYLKLMERAQDENRLSLINMISSKKNHVIHTKKPDHLK